MNTTLVFFGLTVGLMVPFSGQAFTNLNFEDAAVVQNNPVYGRLDWNVAAPGWSHSSGSDTSIINSGHLGVTQSYMLYGPASPVHSPGSLLAGSYSFGFSSGYASSTVGAPWVQAYLSQTGPIASDVQSIRFLARGPFEVFVGGARIPVQALGGDAYAGDISAFAGTTAEFRILNTSSRSSYGPVVVDEITFSPVAVPEPSTVALTAMGVFALFFCRLKMWPPMDASGKD